MPNPDQHPGPAPIIKDTKRMNCPFVISGADENGNQEVSYIVGPAELETFVISPQGREEMVKAFSGGIEPVSAADIAEVARTKKA